MIFPSEYDVAYEVKEWLLEHDWSILAFNPPGAQGTFSIPNPAKDSKNKGQTGTIAPDIVAIKNTHVVIAECKDYKKSGVLKDVEKISKLVADSKRMLLFKKIVQKMCVANNIKLDKDFHIIIAVGYGGKLLVTEITSKYAEMTDSLQTIQPKTIQNFHIEITDQTRNIKIMDADVDPMSTINTTLYATDCDIKDILLCGGSGDEKI